MKRLFLFVVAALFCMTKVMAWNSDSIKAPRYISHFSLNLDDGILRFRDDYKTGHTLNRSYTVYFAYRGSETSSYNDPSSRFGEDIQLYPRYIHAFSKFPYHYKDYKTTRTLPLSNGGYVEVDVSELIDTFYKRGENRLIIFVEPAYLTQTNTGQSISCSYYTQGKGGDIYNNFIINYYETDLPHYHHTLEIAPTLKYLDNYTVSATLQAFSAFKWKLQTSTDEKNWNTVKTGTVDYDNALVGKTVTYKHVMTDHDVLRRYYRLTSYFITSVVWTDTVYTHADVEYPLDFDNDHLVWKKKGDTFMVGESDCQTYKISSAIPVEVKKDYGQTKEYIMSGCPVHFYSVTPTYTVKFLDADYTVLKTQTVNCGDDAEAPADPTYGGLTFRQWSKDFTDVHRDLTVMAEYYFGLDYQFDTEMAAHANDVYPANGFAGNQGKAMIGDKLTFTADVRTPAESRLYFETATYSATDDKYIWTAPTNNLVGTFSASDAAAGQAKQFSKTVDVCYNPNTKYENPFQHRFAFRFYLASGGDKVYSDPFEFDVYYMIGFNSNIASPSDPALPDELYVISLQDNMEYGSDFVIPARYGDKIQIIRDNGSDGAGLTFKRVTYPTRDLETGVDEDGKAYVVCPGETETIEVSARQRVVVFDGVYGNGYPKQFDFSAEGKGKFNGYYAQITDCGSSVTMPADPTQEGYFFTGWKSWNDDEYADNAYLQVPAGDDAIGFTAQWEEVPPVPTYTVRFLGKDGSVLSTQTVSQSDNAVPPPAPTIAGWTFMGWDKGYSNITADTDITALYMDDSTKAFLVVYKDRIGAIDSDNIYTVGNELVENGKSAKGAPITRKGYEFVCWSLTLPYNDYTAADLSNITADIEVYAKWKATGGDVNKDGTIDKTDVELTVQYIIGKNPANFFKNAADLNGDKKVDAADLVLLIEMVKK